MNYEIALNKVLKYLRYKGWTTEEYGKLGYKINLISNDENLSQEVSRILTIYKDEEGKSLKPYPIVHYLVDDAGNLSKSCLRNCVLNTHKKLKHKISKESWKILKPYLYTASLEYDGDKIYKSQSNISKSASLRLKGLFSKDLKS